MSEGKDLKLYEVMYFYKNSDKDILTTYGGTSGQTRQEKKLWPGSSPHDAMNSLKEMMYTKIERFNERLIKWEEYQQDPESFEFPPHEPLSEPDVPVLEDKWHAREFVISGYAITVTRDDEES